MTDAVAASSAAAATGPALRLAGKRCLVTDGAVGLGRAMGEAFAAAGARVAFTFAGETADADEAREAIAAAARASSSAAPGAEPLAYRGSAADAKHVQATVGDVVARWGGVDVLVNNAGVTQILPVALLEEADWDRMMDETVKAAYLFSRAVLKSMIRARAGHILTVGSFASERIVEAPVHFAAARSALRGFTEALAREVGRYNIKVNMLSPGLLDVGMANVLPQHRIADYRSQSALGRLGTAAEVARMAAFLVSDENSFMTGAKIVADGGL